MVDADGIALDRLQLVLSAYFERCGLDERSADEAARVVVYAESRGVVTHGLEVMARIYVPGLLDGSVGSHCDPVVVQQTVASVNLDAGGALGLLAGTKGMQVAIEIARRAGIGLCTVRNSTHFGPAGFYAWLATDSRMIGVCMSNCGFERLVPALGSKQRMLGTNPMAIGVPGRSRPFLLDMSTSVVPAGKVRLAKDRGEVVPAGWLRDSAGSTVTEPDRFFEGSADLDWLGGGLATGGAKGFGLAVAIELMAGVLSGAAVAATPSNQQSGPWNTDVGHLFIAIDPSAYGSGEDFENRVGSVLASLESSTPTHPGIGVSTPGGPEADTLTRSVRDGLELTARRRDLLNQIGHSLDSAGR